MTENNLIHKSAYTITSADTDMYSRIRLGSLVNLLIQSAIRSADNLGFGHLKLVENKLFWVLSRLRVDIAEPLKWYDQVEVITWPKNIDGLLYLRDFEIKCGPVTTLRATSGWLAVDIESKRPKNISFSNPEPFTILKDKHALQIAPEKLEALSEGDIFPVNPSYYDLDMNRHVTSSRYIDWIMDTFSPGFHKQNYPKALSINYLKEIKYGESIRIIREKVADKEYLFEGNLIDKASTVFRGKLSF